ncbi:MAG: GNAT family N-acetyltransferase, partial [Bacteroidia bacterium]|nr:GNAT family N-acetyltransferase [Bacteroidia bacterium]
MEIRDYKVGDEFQIKELFELVFRQSYSVELWRWRFEQNPAGQRKIKLMWDNDKLIGQYAVSPVDMLINNNLHKAALSLGTMTHPEFEGKGVFKSLAKALYSSLEEEGFVGVWGFPNDNSHGGFIHSLGWINLGVQHSLSIDCKNYLIKENEIDFNNFKILNFDISHTNFIEKLTLRENLNLVSKKHDYLNWRYNLKPEVKYYKYFGEINGTKFLIVAKLYKDRLRGTTILNLLEFYIDNYSNLNEILSALIKSFNEEIETVNIWKSLFTSEHLKFERIGFKL